MKLTEGAVKALRRGAVKNDLEINAVTDDGTEWEAGQVIYKDDPKLRKAMKSETPEYNPVLQVEERLWLGFWGVVPTIKFVVTDGEDKIVMYASHRTFAIAKSFMRRWGDGGKGKLGVGMRFQLLDYTTQWEKKGRNHDEDEACIMVETVRAEPKPGKPKMQTKMLSFLRKNGG